jgi:UDP-N-acetylmuramoyl-L-alanyl-D-glutamate--2,6-diaminopimelate ligase
MGEVAARGADLAIVTSDNPRTEDPFAILAAIEEGVIAGGMRRAASIGGTSHEYDVEEDRRTAIGRAISIARAGDTILIAGKGHEDYQIRGNTKFHFDDREEARNAIAERGQA